MGNPQAGLRRVRKQGRITGVFWACNKSFFRFLAARRISDASATFNFVLLGAMNTHMPELTGLNVRATVRVKIPAETKLIARRLATVSRAGGRSWCQA